MKKFSNWIFSLFHIQRLRDQKDSPNKILTETQRLKSNCILEIQNEIELLWLLILALQYKLSIKTLQNYRVLLYKDEFEKEIRLNNPVFTESEIARIKSKHWLYRIILIGFIIAEAFLYYLVAALFVPGGAEYMKITVSVFLAVLIMVALDYAFEKHFLFREASARFARKELSEAEFKTFKDKRTIAYVIIVLASGTILAAGLARIYFMEYIPSNGLTPEKIIAIKKASKMASFVTLFVTLITGILMAVLKLEQAKNGIKFMVYQVWHKAHVRRNEYSQQLIKNARKIKLVAEDKIQKYWQLIIELRRIFQIDTEYDTKHEALNAEFLILISQPAFVMTDDVYRKFARIESAHEILFEYGIFNNQGIKEKIEAGNKILKMTTDHIDEHLPAKSNAHNEADSRNKINDDTLNSRSKNNHVAYTINTILIALLFSLFCSCRVSQTTDNKPVNTIALVDMSDSRDSLVFNWYKSVIKNSIIANLGQHDLLEILPIDNGSKTSSTEIFKVDFGKNNYTNEFAGLSAKETEQNSHRDSVKAAMQRFEQSLNWAIRNRQASSVGTDITGALSVSKKYFREDCTNLIVILSDMQQYSDKDKMNFEKYLNDPSEIEHFISLAEKSDLKGASVIVITGSNKISTQKFNVLASFWDEYFKVCKAQLVDYSSGAVSVLENYISQNGSNAAENQ